MRFRKSIKVAPGVRLNLSKSGVSTTIGGRGLSVNTGRKGTYLNTSIPGTGLSKRQRILKGDKPTQGHYTAKVAKKESTSLQNDRSLDGRSSRSFKLIYWLLAIGVLLWAIL